MPQYLNVVVDPITRLVSDRAFASIFCFVFGVLLGLVCVKSGLLNRQLPSQR